ncbi:MAG: hypothetical protein COA91_01600 [Robiginitomaculum sp.]|nr:MAG: hypothetical protein COA91_01600 [Robiginitomaculum sp.]
MDIHKFTTHLIFYTRLTPLTIRRRASTHASTKVSGTMNFVFFLYGKTGEYSSPKPLPCPRLVMS